MNLGNSRKLFVFAATVLGAFTVCSYSVNGQERNIFPDMSKLAQQVDERASAAKSWTEKFTSPLSKGLESPKPVNWPKLGLFKNAESSRPLGSRPNFFENLPKLFPERDPSRPNFFEDMNQRTKSLFNRTNDGLGSWATQANDRAKSKTFEAWDSITKGLKNPLGNLAKPAPPTAQPPVRSAQMIEGSPKVKF